MKKFLAVLFLFGLCLAARRQTIFFPNGGAGTTTTDEASARKMRSAPVGLSAPAITRCPSRCARSTFARCSPARIRIADCGLRIAD